MEGLIVFQSLLAICRLLNKQNHPYWKGRQPSGQGTFGIFQHISGAGVDFQKGVTQIWTPTV